MTALRTPPAKRRASGPSGKHLSPSQILLRERPQDVGQHDRWRSRAAEAKRTLVDWIRVTLDGAE